MRQMMVINYPPNRIRNEPYKEFHVCPSCLVPVPKSNITEMDAKEIIHYRSEQHAWDSGWRKVIGIKFCQPDQEYVWVCPDCWRKATVDNKTKG